MIRTCAALLALCLIAFANSGAEASPLDGFYVDATAPYAVIDYDQLDEINTTRVDAGALGNSGLNAGVEAGYGFTLSDLIYLAFGAEARISENSVSQTKGGASDEDTLLFGAAVKGKIGFFPDEQVLVYGAVGGSLGGVSLDDVDGVERGLVTGGSPAASFGLGARYLFDEDIAVTAEYEVQRALEVELSDDNAAATRQPMTSSFALGINYAF